MLFSTKIHKRNNKRQCKNLKHNQINKSGIKFIAIKTNLKYLSNNMVNIYNFFPIGVIDKKYNKKF